MKYTTGWGGEPGSNGDRKSQEVGREGMGSVISQSERNWVKWEIFFQHSKVMGGK